MKTRIEEAATEYAYKNDGGSDPRYCGLEDGFLAGAEFMQDEVKELKAQNEIMREALKVVGWHCSDDGSHDPDEMCDVIEEALKKVGEV